MEALAAVKDEAYQDHILKGVSRTFALTIPQLPQTDGLRFAVANAYLLCRITDTIEDEPAMSIAQKKEFHEQFVQVVDFKYPAETFAKDCERYLSDSTLPAERDLILNSSRVIRCLQSLNPKQQTALQKCVRIMSEGMPLFEREASLAGLPSLESHGRYCYYVAGVVGEMLTELFCDYSPDIAKNKDKMMSLAPLFGQGLQMTNILKDIWDDRKRGVCWLPRDLFSEMDCDLDLDKILNEADREAFVPGLYRLLKVAMKCLQNAMQYTLLLPRSEVGIRRFCLWAIGLAVLTLRNIHKHPTFTKGTDVKVSRKTLKRTILGANICCSHNTLLKYFFNSTSKSILCTSID